MEIRIAIVTETFHPYRGGSSKRYHEVFKRLARRGHEVELYTARLDPRWSMLEEVDGVVVHRSDRVHPNFITGEGFRSIGSVLGFTAWSLRELLGDGDFDVVEANHCPIFPAMGSWLHSRLRDTPLSITFHEAWHADWYRFAPRRIYAPLGIALEGITTKLPDLAIAVSNMTAQRLIEFFGMPKSRIRVISNGVDLDHFGRVRCARDRLRLVYAGRLNPHKRLEWLLEAYGLVRQDYPGVSLDIVGDGPMMGQYMEYAEANGLRDVIFHGSVDDVELVRCLKGAGVFVLPSIREGQSITVLEAMAAGTPQVVVAVDGSGAAELLAMSNSGIAVKPSPTAIAEAVKEMLGDECLWRSLQDRGLSFIRSYSWDRVAEEHIGLYEGLAGC
ncbi:MAG: glycosyltransferase family 4 protein [Candidatus Geothermarchaeales archaeon]